MLATELHLTRERALTPDGVFGTLIVLRADVIIGRFATVEDDWRNNEPGESCIPPAPGPAVILYTVERSYYHGGGYEAFHVLNVPNRSRILLHIANTEEDVKGCIGIGRRHEWLEVDRDEDTGQRHVRKRAVVESRAGFREFMGLLEGVQRTLLRVAWAQAGGV